MTVSLQDTKEKIVKYVLEHQGEQGYYLTQNKVKDEIIAKDGGSPNTFTHAFEELLDPEVDGKLQRNHVKKKIFVLVLSNNEEKLTEFRNNLKHVKHLLDIIEKFPEVGDCFQISKKSKIPRLSKYYQREMQYNSRLLGYTVDYQSPKNPSQAYCLQARYDLLRNLPIFLVDYVNKPTNGFSKIVKNEAMKIIQPILFDCIQKVQSDYTESPYYSNKYLESQKQILAISVIKGTPLQDTSAEFLRILGRYYFLISEKLSNFDIDSCKEHKIISEFVRSFYPKSRIRDDKLSDSLTEDPITDYWFGDEKYRKQRLTKEMIKRLDEVHECLGGKFAKRFDKYENNDHYAITDYYYNWIFTLGIFSRLEKRIIQLYFKDLEEDQRKSKQEDHDEILDLQTIVKQKDFKGKLYKTSKGQAVIYLDKKYSEVESHVGRWTRILIEEK